MPALLSRLGIRGQLLVAPAVVLILMAVLGLAGVRGLRAAAQTARTSAAEITAVEILRDSNSRMFEGHRFQSLALAADNRKDFDDMLAENADVMKESADGFRQFAKVARTPALRQEALAQAALIDKIQHERLQAFALAKPAIGAPLPAAAAKIVAGVEDDIETADGSNDKLVENEQAVITGIAEQAQASAASAQRLVWILLALAALLAAGVSFLIARPLVRGARGLLDAARGIAAGDLAQHVDVRVGGELGATAGAFEQMVDYLRTMERAGERIAESDPTLDGE